MITRFEFFAPSSRGTGLHIAGAPLRRHGAGSASFSVAIAQDDLDRNGYGRASYARMDVSTMPDRGFERPDVNASSSGAELTLNTRTLIRTRRRRGGSSGDAAELPAGVLLITLCTLLPEERGRFLEQFSRAARFMETQQGFVSGHLFEALPGHRDGSFVNVARWTDVSTFKAVFASPSFKQIIVGGFQPRSQIMIAPFHHSMAGKRTA